jgi:AraC-like DNA-binding protein
MQNTTEQAVERVINAMRNNLAEQLTVDDMARAAMFSKFHFSRIFQRVTGISPGRFLSALRLQEAKQLLVNTSLNVADISLRVGYSSVGTFSTRFTKSVGLSPTTYRRLQGFIPHIHTQATTAPATAVVHGHIHPAAQVSQPGLIFIGLFPNRIPEGRPVRCAILNQPGPFRLSDVPDGAWYLLCHSVNGDPHRIQRDKVTVATVGPIITAAHTVTTANVHLKPLRTWDPPVLMALLDTRKTALNRVAEQQTAAA